MRVGGIAHAAIATCDSLSRVGSFRVRGLRAPRILSFYKKNQKTDLSSQQAQWHCWSQEDRKYVIDIMGYLLNTENSTVRAHACIDTSTLHTQRTTVKPVAVSLLSEQAKPEV